MNIAITGVTGALGRMVFLEFLKQHLSSNGPLRIFALTKRAHRSIVSTLKKEITSRGFRYLQVPRSDLANLNRWVESIVTTWNCDLESNVWPVELQRTLASRQIDCFLHLASSTDLRRTSRVEADLQQINVVGTKLLLNLIRTCDVRHLIYVSTAYACGRVSGEVAPSFCSDDFRTPYEKTKRQAELLCKEFSVDTGTPCSIVRPSVLCGQLLEMPLGHISNFNVFYEWGAFFFKVKQKHAMHQISDMGIRIHVHTYSGLNIVPIDYAAKVLVALANRPQFAGDFHIVNAHPVHHRNYIAWILRSVGINDFSFVFSEPECKNLLERMYYRSVGSLFAPYITSELATFSRANVNALESVCGFSCPRITADNFALLMHFARRHNFGVTT